MVLRNGKGSDAPLGWCGVPVPAFEAMLRSDLEKFGDDFEAYQQAVRQAKLENSVVIARNRAAEREYVWRGILLFGLPFIFGRAPKPQKLKVVTNGHIPESGIFEKGPNFAMAGLRELARLGLVRVQKKGRAPNKFDVLFPTPELLTLAGRFFIC